MSNPSAHISFALLLILLLSTSCQSEEPTVLSDDHPAEIGTGTAVLQTDSDEWRVYVFATDVLYGSSYSVDSPYHIPYKEEAQVLRQLSYGTGEQRYVTCDGYTFGMPSASVSKAGSKTKYSVLGLWKRKNIIDVGF
jgi:hypothetical protein